MYLQHFNLRQPPFEMTGPLTANIYIGDAQAEAIERLSMALTSTDSVAVLTGQAGVGKTTIALAAAHLATSEPSVLCLSMVPDDPNELVMLALLYSGVEINQIGHAEAVSLWRKLIQKRVTRNIRTVIVVEDADDLGDRLLQTLHALTKVEPGGHAGANLILTGSPALTQLLTVSSLESLRQRIRVCCHIEPLSCQDMTSLLSKGIRSAGGSATQLFGPGSLELLHSYAGGLPRLGQALCDSALSIAASRDEAIVTARAIRDAALASASGAFDQRRSDAASEPLLSRDTSPDSHSRLASSRKELDVPTLRNVVGIRDYPANDADHASSPSPYDQGPAQSAIGSDGAMSHDDDPNPPSESLQSPALESERAQSLIEVRRVYDEEEYAEEIEAALRAQSGEC